MAKSKFSARVSAVAAMDFSDNSAVRVTPKARRAQKPRAAAAKKEKVVNYTAEQTTQMLEMYVASPTQETVETLAKMFAKTTRSIVAKLSREKVYKAKTYATKSGEAVVKKDELADKLTNLAGLTAAEADSLTKANKTALKKIVYLLEKAQVE